MLIYKDCIDESEGLQYTCDPCDITEGGGVRSLCLIKKGTTLPNPITQLDIDILVGTGLIYVMPQTRGNFDGGTPKMITGYGDNKERNIGSDYVLQVLDPVFADNYSFWSIVENVENWNIAFRTETQLAVVYDHVTITTKAPSEEAIDTEVVWNIEAKWFSKSKPIIMPYVAGVFDNILKINEVITGLTLASGTVTPQKISVEVDSDKTAYVIQPDGSLLTSVAGVIDTTWAGAAGDVILIVQRTNTSFSIAGSDFSGNMSFMVLNKTIIDLTGNQFTNPQCDFIVDILIANGEVTGTHTIDFTDNIASPTAGKVTIAEGLGWTIPF